MSLIFRSKTLQGKSGYFADSVGIGVSAPSDSLHISGGNIRVEGGDAYFENRPFVSGVPVMVQGDLFDVDTTSFYPKSNPSGFITGVDTSNFYTNDNPSGFITGIDTSNFYTNDNPSGFITTGNLTGYVSNNTSNISGSTILRNMMQITQSGYNAITPAANTLYIIVG
jgi:hypothetical protein